MKSKKRTLVLKNISVSKPSAGWSNLILTHAYLDNMSSEYQLFYPFSYVRESHKDILQIIEDFCKKICISIDGYVDDTPDIITFDSEVDGDHILIISNYYVLHYCINDTEENHLFLYPNDLDKKQLYFSLLESLEKNKKEWIEKFNLDKDFTVDDFEYKIKTLKNILGGK